ncbi:TPA: hypothetical protein L6A41_31425 [Pseudomonas aeruginosa]|jgi:hypothetical protein|uniref:Uncharacterized protein n=3 Tax=Pseudomonas TaxID=286 RepID=A0ABD7JW57_PSEAI|nr:MULTISPECIES: hypothetical protein [Pseudomonas]AVK09265.1 hypothetical protein CSB93_6791 [Pseudomonas paraeruginosa]AWE95635.1 hypothetical protein CSC28_6645 [Pseudomonas paraeruginosa]EKB9387634.1 hypothetical protein [Pseudomonas aeruginosa]EKU4830177.1 hypothetical protein [Pseudomonas aeruginosa]EKW2946524.1 hypothetical protein [Pseudomonas aeruginosa]
MSTSNQAFEYYTRCIDLHDGESARSKGQAISDLVEAARKITFKSLAKHVTGLEELNQQLGYGRGLRLQDDYHVTYWKGVYRGEPAYFLIHSAIEHVFIRPSSRAAIRAETDLQNSLLQRLAA